MSHAQAGESPPVPAPYANLQSKLEELEAYTHTVLQQYPRAERHLLCADIRKSLAAIQRLTVVARANFRRLAERYAEGEIGLAHIQPRVASFLAYTKHCDARETVRGVLADFTLQRSPHADHH